MLLIDRLMSLLLILKLKIPINHYKIAVYLLVKLFWSGISFDKRKKITYWMKLTYRTGSLVLTNWHFYVLQPLNSLSATKNAEIQIIFYRIPRTVCTEGELVVPKDTIYIPLTPVEISWSEPHQSTSYCKKATHRVIC